MGVTIEAPAKINLYLHVTGRRDDGYHLLDSLVVFAGFGDTLTFEPASTLSFEVDGATAGLPADGDNIVLKAARALATATGVTAGARIRLTKRLPVAAGVGGGSADAAATLTGLSRLWGIELPGLNALALTLGADVPVCLRGVPTAMSGVGERLAAVPPLPAAWLVLVNPGVPLSTPAVFKARRGAFSAADPLAQAPTTAAALAEALARRHNDLTVAAVSLAPVVAEVLAALAATPGCLLSRMSGSGATCFGLYGDETAARAAAAALRGSGWWIEAAELQH
jgi:4-diphosphocytidyl-2-C-methyl-D-erythritol kinase